MNENNNVVIYTSSLCGFCYKAKVLLSNYNMNLVKLILIMIMTKEKR